VTLRQLRYLIAIVEAESFTRAAERLLVSQPALSHQIRALERSTGAALLERRPRSVALTARGRELLPHARAAVASADAAVAAARAVGALEDGELRLASLYSIALGVVPPLIRAWRGRHPGVRIELQEFSGVDRLVAEMATGAADVAVGPVPERWDGPVRPLGAEAFVIALPAGDPLLRGEGPVRLEQLAGRPWVLYSRDSGLTPFVARACREAGFSPRPAARAHHTVAALELAAAGLGPALVPRNVVSAGLAGCVAATEPPVRRALAAFARPTPSPAAEAFMDVAVAHAEL
jgi:DNA-binding transcriptional LysR family regulator